MLLAHWGYTQPPFNLLETAGAYAGNAKSQDNHDAKQDLYISVFKANVPVLFNRKKGRLLSAGIEYHYIYSKLNNWDYNFNNNEPQHFQNAYFNLNYFHRIGEKVTLISLLSPSIGSEIGKPLSSEDFFLRMQLGFSYRFSSKFKAGAGLAHVQVFEHSNWIPTLFLTYKPNSQWNIKAALPFNLDVDYAFKNERTVLSYIIRTRGNMARLKSYDEQELDNARLITASTQLRIKHRVYKRLHASFSVGTSFFRRLIFYDNSGNELQQTDFLPSPYVQIGLSVQLNSNSK